MEELIKTIESMYKVEKHCAEQENDCMSLMLLETLWNAFNTSTIAFPSKIDTTHRYQHIINSMYGYAHDPKFAKISVVQWTQQFLEENENNPKYNGLIKPFDTGIVGDFTVHLV